MDELAIPSAALRDPAAWEPLRVWIAEQKLHCSLKVGVYEENGPIPEDTAWGIILADVAKHIAEALSQEGLRDREIALREIFRSFSSELGEPTSLTSGSFID